MSIGQAESLSGDEPVSTRWLPTDLRTEYARDPLGIDEPSPRFSWLLNAGAFGPRRQTAYHLVVSRDRTAAAAGRGEMWDSGQVESTKAGQISYCGATLRARDRCHWSVRLWDDENNVSAWSEPASFEMGLLGSQDWDEAVWIAGDTTDIPTPPSPLLRRTFRLVQPNVERARLYVSALGYGEIYIDGQRVGTRVLDPAPTNYDATVLYSTYDVTEQVAHGAPAGDRVLAVMLGRGRYGELMPNTWLWEKAPWWDHPKLLAHLMVWYADGQTQQVVTDASWRTTHGPVRFDSLYSGERYDARLSRPGWTAPGFDDADWVAAALATPPRGQLRAGQHEPIEVVAEIEPVGLTEPAPGVFVVDFGQQVAGWARLRLAGPAGAELRVCYGERLDENGLVEVSQGHVLGEIQTDTYVLRGEGAETYEPRFSYKGFQYAQISGHPSRPELDDVRALVIHNAVGSVGDFGCDDELVNWLHHSTRWAILNNLHGVPTDTPVYEKNGWTGDAHLTANVAAYNFDMARFYTKWLQDWADAQLPSGELPPIVPTSGWGYRGSLGQIVAPIPAWDVAYVEIPWVMYWHYGDERILARHYDAQRRYVDYLVNGFLDDDVITVGLGDWVPPGSMRPPEGPAVHETAYAFRIVELLHKIARVLGRDDDRSMYGELSKRIRTGFHRSFFDPASTTYHGDIPTDYRQTPNVLALAFNLVPADARQTVLDNLVGDIKARDDHLNTGVLGTKFLFPLLTAAGLVDLAFTVATQRTYPGYGYWFEQGATALYEMWEADSRSLDHHFYGTVDQWLIEDIAGVAPAEPGFARARIRPVPPAALRRAAMRLNTVRGQLASSWHRVDGGLELQIDLPPGTPGEVHVPVPTPDERTPEHESDTSSGAHPLHQAERHVVFAVEPGRHRFRT